MSAFRIRLKDETYRDFLVQLLSQLDFVEWSQETSSEIAAPQAGEYDLFASAGMWKDYSIDAKTLRESAWRR